MTNEAHGPHTEHPHVYYGICTCPDPRGDGRLVPGHYSLTCGLSSHRVRAAAQAEVNRKD